MRSTLWWRWLCAWPEGLGNPSNQQACYPSRIKLAQSGCMTMSTANAVQWTTWICWIDVTHRAISLILSKEHNVWKTTSWGLLWTAWTFFFWGGGQEKSSFATASHSGWWLLGNTFSTLEKWSHSSLIRCHRILTASWVGTAKCKGSVMY